VTDTLLRADAHVDAARVLRAGSDALTAASERLDRATFDRAVEALADCPGEVAVVGLGTPGHVAGLLAALLASRGTPAAAVAPSTASVAALTADDVVLAVGAGSAAAELAPLLHGLRQRDVLVVALIGNEAHALGEAADLALDTGPSPELDALVVMAVGEALARGAAAVRGEVLPGTP
jgi:arabinose-5-phosphate isomerase